MDEELSKWESGERTGKDATSAKAHKVSHPGAPPPTPVGTSPPIPVADAGQQGIRSGETLGQPTPSEAKRPGGSLLDRASRAKRSR